MEKKEQRVPDKDVLEIFGLLEKGTKVEDIMEMTGYQRGTIKKVYGIINHIKARPGGLSERSRMFLFIWHFAAVETHRLAHIINYYDKYKENHPDGVKPFETRVRSPWKLDEDVEKEKKRSGSGSKKRCKPVELHASEIW